MAGKIPRTIFALVEPAVWSLAARLLILTTDRRGSKKHQPTVATFYETGVVTALYEALLMSPVLAHLEIRHEMSFKTSTGKGAPKQVDLWLRPHNGGSPIMIEAGDYGVGKVHRDLAKLKKLNPNGTNWFLAFFREGAIAAAPLQELERSFKRKNGLNAAKVHMEKALVRSVNVFRPGKPPDPFGVALLRGK
ncbi:MAG TPA: hypothetical protein PLP01_14540 [Phycisphaerae bacterium]|nr:hypothetical protein [Phycisphaerae bacterium]